MRCPKCGYISFDYNEVCPKCNKDISAEREKMNLPSYKPTPPSISGGAAKGAGGSAAAEQEAGVRPEETIELKFSSSQDLDTQSESATEESVDLLGLSPKTIEQEGTISFDLDELPVPEESAEDLDASASADEEEEVNLSLDLEDLDLDLNLEEPDDNDKSS